MTEILIGDFVLALLIFLRIFSMMVAAPVLGHGAFPPIAKIFLCFVIAYMTFLTIDKANVLINLNLISIFVNAAKEIVTGLVMGYTLNFVFYGIAYAGSLIGYDMGLMFAEVLNPMQETQNNVVGEVIFYAAIMVFFLINGHHHFITAVVASFNVVPVAKWTVNEPLLQLVIKYSFAVFTIALKIASPILVSFFLVHIAEGIIARVIPNIQVFFVAQPVKIGLGFLLLSLLVPIYIFAIKNFLQRYEDQLTQIIKAMSV